MPIMPIKAILLIVLAAITIWFLWIWWLLAKQGRGISPNDPAKQNTWYHTIVAFVMCFFDTLGIGNFATTTSAFKFRGSMLDEKIPGTLNVGYAIPTVAQAFIYITAVPVEIWTLVLMIAASVAGAWLGAGVVAKWPRRNIQIGMGFALLMASTVLIMQIIATQPLIGGFVSTNLPSLQPIVAEITRIFKGGESTALHGVLLAVGLFGNFALGALMTLGIGLYAPCLILVSLLGMTPGAAFPIMMGSCAFLMPIGGVRFMKEGSYSLPAALVMSVAGLPAVLVAAYLVVSMNMDKLRWVVLFVVIYTAIMMLRSAMRERTQLART
ncbi:MAG: permease [Acidobacteria bacterium]|nr:MAG: permease [Acidobacteriota bacterium]